MLAYPLRFARRLRPRRPLRRARRHLPGCGRACRLLSRRRQQASQQHATRGRPTWGRPTQRQPTLRQVSQVVRLLPRLLLTRPPLLPQEPRLEEQAQRLQSQRRSHPPTRLLQRAAAAASGAAAPPPPPDRWFQHLMKPPSARTWSLTGRQTPKRLQRPSSRISRQNQNRAQSQVRV